MGKAKVNPKHTSKNKQKKGGSGGEKKKASAFKKGGKAKKKEKHTWKSVRERKRGGGKQDTGGVPSIQAVVPKVKVPKVSSSKTSKPDDSSSLRSRMMQRLSVARFRTINESIDSSAQSSTASNPLNNPKTFETYHSGLSSTSSSWKINPVDNIISWITSTFPPTHVIADFGCGNAKLGQSIPNKTHSFDLHALNPDVTACDMKNVPLPDSSVDVAIFCLSLMGSDVTDYLKEAWRVLKPSGIMKIAEVSNRLSGDLMGKFCKGMRAIGFKQISCEDVGEGDVFVLMEFRKVAVRTGRGGRAKECKILLGTVTYKKR